MRQILPEPSATPLDDEDLAAAYACPDREWLRVNMVASVDGAAWLDGLSGGLSGAGDRRIFGILRGLADVILAGAATVRGEGYRPARRRPAWEPLRAGRPPAPPIAVVTRRLDLDLDAELFTDAPPYARTIVITTEAAPEERRRAAAERAEVIVAGADRVDVRRAVAALRDLGHRHILCEGGPRLNAQLVAAGLVDELCLTISPMLVGGGAARILDGTSSPTGLRLAHVLTDNGFLFCRYTREDA